jgi:hypothetical protein
MKTQAVVYWIRLPEHTDPRTEGYVGVSKRYESRLLDHYNAIQKGTHKNPHLVNAVNKYGWDTLIKEALYTGEEHECYEVESTYRTSKAVGWNISPGGHRGPGWPAGRKKSAASIAKQKATMDKRNAERRGEKAEARKKRLIAREQKRLDKLAAIADKRAARVAKRQAREMREKQLLAERNRRLQKRIDEGTADQTYDLSNRPICPECNTDRCAINYWRKGKPYFRKICDGCGKKKEKKKPGKPNWTRSGYKKKTTCDCCGFKATYHTQTTVFHIDGNLNNVDLHNLRTICLNCVEVVKRKEVTWKRGDLTVDY